MAQFRHLFGTVLSALIGASGACADVAADINALRLNACAGPAGRPLIADARLDAAAEFLAQGRSLAAALAQVGYLSSKSASVIGYLPSSTDELDGLAAARSCAVLADPDFAQVGVKRQGRHVWLVLAAPLVVPSIEQTALIRREILSRVNAARAAGHRCGTREFAPAPPLVQNEALTRAALAHSEEMVAYGRLDHLGRDGSTPAVRIARAGYGAYRMVAENIASGAMSAAEVAQGWLESPPHCANLMEAQFSEIGIAFAVSNQSAKHVFWTEDFAAPAEP